jgi:hypothetical protein
MAQLFVNNWSATLTTALTASGTALNLSRADLPAIAGGDWMLLTLEGANGATEIVKATARSAGSASCTVQRGQEGTAAVAWSIGSKVENRLTAGTLATLNARIWSYTGTTTITTSNFATYFPDAAGGDYILNSGSAARTILGASLAVGQLGLLNAGKTAWSDAGNIRGPQGEQGSAASVPDATITYSGKVQLADLAVASNNRWIATSSKIISVLSGDVGKIFYNSGINPISILGVNSVGPGDGVMATDTNAGVAVGGAALDNAKAVTARGVYAATSDLIVSIAAV